MQQKGLQQQQGATNEALSQDRYEGQDAVEKHLQRKIFTSIDKDPIVYRQQYHTEVAHNINCLAEQAGGRFDACNAKIANWAKETQNTIQEYDEMSKKIASWQNEMNSAIQTEYLKNQAILKKHVGPARIDLQANLAQAKEQLKYAKNEAYDKMDELKKKYSLT